MGVFPYSPVMKASDSQDVVIDLESLPHSRTRNGGFHSTLSNVRRAHSRSASWSLPSRQGSDFGRGLVALNPMTPITNVIREIVPSFGQHSRTADSSGRVSPHVASPHTSRNPSQTSLLGQTIEQDGNTEEAQETRDLSSGHDSLRTLGDPSSNVNVHLPREHLAVHMGGPGPPEEANVGLELSDSMRWLEQNAIFIILLLLKFAWYHRSGKIVGHRSVTHTMALGYLPLYASKEDMTLCDWVAGVQGSKGFLGSKGSKRWLGSKGFQKVAGVQRFPKGDWSRMVSKRWLGSNVSELTSA